MFSMTLVLVRPATSTRQHIQPFIRGTKLNQGKQTFSMSG